MRYAPSLLETVLLCKVKNEFLRRQAIWPSHTWPRLQISPTFLHHHHSEMVSVVAHYLPELCEADSAGWETWNTKARTVQVPYRLQKLASTRTKISPCRNQLTLVKSAPGLIFFGSQEVGRAI